MKKRKFFLILFLVNVLIIVVVAVLLAVKVATTNSGSMTPYERGQLVGQGLGQALFFGDIAAIIIYFVLRNRKLKK